MKNRIKLPPNRRKPPARKQTTPGHRNIAYLRVSTALQDADNQKLGIVEYTYAEGLQPVEFIEETTSGKTPISERKLQQVIDSMVQGDTLIMSELSRLGRNMVEVMVVLDLLIKKGCKVHAVKGDEALQMLFGILRQRKYDVSVNGNDIYAIENITTKYAQRMVRTISKNRTKYGF